MRIQRSIEHGWVVFTLTGCVRAEQVPELLTLLKSETPVHRVVLDLDQVKLVDRDAVLFLALNEARGIRLQKCPGFIREQINHERNLRQRGAEA